MTPQDNAQLQVAKQCIQDYATAQPPAARMALELVLAPIMDRLVLAPLPNTPAKTAQEIDGSPGIPS